MKTWLVVAVLGIAACQAGAIETISQPIDQGDYCEAEQPPASKWKPGDPLPKSTANTVILTAELDKDLWGAYGADPIDGKIVWRLRLTTSEMNRFQGVVAAGTQPYGGVRGPVAGCSPRCGDDPPAGLILAHAKIELQVQPIAEAEYAACGK